MPKRFEYKLNLGKDMNGKLIRKSFYSTKSKSDAKKKADAYRVKYELELCSGGNICISRQKFSDWAIYALQTYKKPFVKGNTYIGTYLEPVNLHLIPFFGSMYMDDIRPLHIQKYINEASKKYAPETVKKDFHCLKLLFDTAVDNQVCTKNPITNSINLPKYETRYKKQAYSQEEYNTVYRFAKKHKHGLAIMTLLETGVSRSELLGLRFSDLDITNKCIHINQGLVAYHSDDVGKQVLESSGLKNKFRKRSIPITDNDLWERLSQAPRTVIIGTKTIILEHIFSSPEGKPYQPNNWSNRVYKSFMKDLSEAYPDIPILSPHELRHTRATLWIAQGIEPYMVARLLGHSDLNMLTKVYDHTSSNTLRNALLDAHERIKKEESTG